MSNKSEMERLVDLEFNQLVTAMLEASEADTLPPLLAEAVDDAIRNIKELV